MKTNEQILKECVSNLRLYDYYVNADLVCSKSRRDDIVYQRACVVLWLNYNRIGDYRIAMILNIHPTHVNYLKYWGDKKVTDYTDKWLKLREMLRNPRMSVVQPSRYECVDLESHFKNYVYDFSLMSEDVKK